MSEIPQQNKVQLKNYEKIIGEREVHSIKMLAEKLKGKSVIHVNSTSFGGGVAEILHSMVPLMQDVGLKVHWKVIKGSFKFFNITKKFHNALQGMNIQITEEEKKSYIEYNKMNSELISPDADNVVIHDAQPALMIKFCSERAGKWIWRCHVDLSAPNKVVISFLKPYIELYHAAIFSMKKYVVPSLKISKIAIIPPSIDPLSDKNKKISENLISKILERYDIDPEKPILTQVARFDPWKDPLGAIDVYRIVKRRIPEAQLLLISSMAHDDPEGWLYYEKTARYAGEDRDIHLLTDLIGVKDLEVNAFQRASDLALQMSVREGFGLSVTEALWKRVPVIGRNVGGIPLQVIDGLTGYLVNDVNEAAKKTLYLLKHKKEAKRMGENGREHVLKNFLITRHLKDYLKLFTELT
jgi:trehalose synthase